ncbi:hypothetical protein [Reyranella sp.]|jgi:hypothetical protein|uniref:hypothetical protein n=1 Tax=Reyranella sp. TaxID=1929291 RepID=UPI002F928A82
MAEMFRLHRQPFALVKSEKIAQSARLQFVGAMIEDHVSFPPASPISVAIV